MGAFTTNRMRINDVPTEMNRIQWLRPKLSHNVHPHDSSSSYECTRFFFSISVLLIWGISC